MSDGMPLRITGAISAVVVFITSWGGTVGEEYVEYHRWLGMESNQYETDPELRAVVTAEDPVKGFLGGLARLPIMIARAIITGILSSFLFICNLLNLWPFVLSGLILCIFWVLANRLDQWK